MSKDMIWVTFAKEGIHCYPAAATDPQLASAKLGTPLGEKYDVSFLAHPHRHIFHFKVYLEVFHDDRDVEFIQFKRWLESLYSDGALELNHRSCEMIAEELYNQITHRYGERDIWIEVSEDGENGCFRQYNR